MLAWIHYTFIKKFIIWLLLTLLFFIVPLPLSSYAVINVANQINSSDENPTTILVYSKNFAKIMGLDESRAMPLDPGIYAIDLVVEKNYYFTFDPNIPFVKQHHLANLTDEENFTINQHLAAFPILFKGEKMPLFTKYICYINLYLKSDDPRLKKIILPNFSMWGIDASGPIAKMISLPIADVDYAIRKANLTPQQNPLTFPKNNTEPEVSIALLANSTRDFVKTNATELNYQSQFLNFMPGVSFLSLQTECDELNDNLNQKRDLNLWMMNKNTNPNELNKDKYNVSDFSRFAIPAELLDSAVLTPLIKHNESLSRISVDAINS